MCAGGVLNASGLSNGLSIASGQNLNVDGNAIGNVTALAGSVVSGSGAFMGNLTAQSGSTIQVGKDGSGVASRILIDNFNNYSVGNINAISTPWVAHQDTTLAAVQSFNGSNALTFGSATDSCGTSRPLPAGTVLITAQRPLIFSKLLLKTTIPTTASGWDRKRRLNRRTSAILDRSFA